MMSDYREKVKDLASNGLFVSITLGILIRLLFIPVSLQFDTNYWTIVIRNIESGNGLYLMEGYYYTPIWGYVLGFVAAIQNALLSIGDPSSVCYDLVSYIMVDHYAYTDMGTSIVFLFILKAILWLSDLILSITVYHLVYERTKDAKKATIAFLLIFICPHVIGSSSMVVMPDTISAMFTMVTILLLKNDKYLLAGITYSLAVWVKFFPIAIILVLLAYIYVKLRNEGKDTIMPIVKAIVGFMASTVLVFLPQALEGTLDRSMAFLTDRIIEIIDYGIITILCSVFLAVLAIGVVVVVVRHMLTTKGNLDDRLMEYSLIVLCICMMLYTNMQYMLSMMPFLVYCLMIVDSNYRYFWASMAVVGFVLTLMLNTNAVMLNSLVIYTDLISSQTAMRLFNFLNDEVIFGFSIVDIFCSFANNLQKVTLFCILPFFILRKFIARKRMMAGESNE